MNAETSIEAIDARVDFSCHKSFPEKNQNFEIKDAELSEAPPDDMGLGPLTPVPIRRNGEASIGSDTPLSGFSSLLKSSGGDSGDSDDSENVGPDFSDQTPKASVFDSFAPGPDKLMCAPRKKVLVESRVHSMRRLDFDYSDALSDEMAENDVEAALEEKKSSHDLKDAVVSMHGDGILAKSPSFDLECDDDFKTPLSSPRSNGSAETCPRAPMKAASARQINFGNDDLGICRRLEF